MSVRTRKLIGTVILVALAIGWPLIGAALLQARIAALSSAGQFAAYVVLGLGWVIPAGILIRWMQRPDSPRR